MSEYFTSNLPTALYLVAVGILFYLSFISLRIGMLVTAFTTCYMCCFAHSQTAEIKQQRKKELHVEANLALEYTL